MIIDVRADHLTVKIEILTAETMLHRLIDSGVTVNFIFFRFMKMKNLIPQKLHASAVREVNNKILTEASSAEYYQIFIKIEIITDTLLFHVLDLLKYDIILDLLWLRMQNSDINWVISELTSWEERKQLYSCNSDELLRDVDEEDTVVIIDLHMTVMNITDLVSWEYKDYEDVFSKREAFKLSSERSELNMNIQLRSNMTSLYDSLYNLSEVELTALCDYLKMNLTMRFIQRFISSAETSILFTKKKNDTLHLCMNYCRLNAITIQDRYLLLLISEILNRLTRVKRFMQLDMIAAYNLLHIKAEQKWMTAFCMQYRNFEYTVMPFDLCNALMTFQSYMNRALRPVMNWMIIAYLDDVLIYSEDLRKHNEHVWAVLSLL